jgi:hypothetical protein
VGILQAAVMAVLLVAGAVGVRDGATEGFGEHAEPAGGFITREWAWPDGATTRTVTAFGPAEQVNRLDPHDPTPHCPDCQLASSMSMGPEGGSGLIEVAQ